MEAAWSSSWRDSCLAQPRVGLLLTFGGFVPPWWFYGPPLAQRGWWAGFDAVQFMALVPPVLLLGVAVVDCVGGWRYFGKREAPDEPGTVPDRGGR